MKESPDPLDKVTSQPVSCGGHIVRLPRGKHSHPLLPGLHDAQVKDVRVEGETVFTDLEYLGEEPDA